MKSKQSADRGLLDYMTISATNEASIRLYYLFYRVEKAIVELRKTSYDYLFEILFSIAAGILTVINLIAYFFQISFLVFTLTAIPIVICSLLYAYRKFEPPSELEEIERPLLLGIHLNQIVKKSYELLYLIELKESMENYKKEFIESLIEDCARILQDSVKKAENLFQEMKQLGLCDEELSKLHIDEAFVLRRINLGKVILKSLE